VLDEILDEAFGLRLSDTQLVKKYSLLLTLLLSHNPHLHSQIRCHPHTDGNSEDRKEPAASPLRDRIRASLTAIGIIRKLDKNRDNRLTRDEVPRQHQATFDAWDTNKDDVVTLKEATAALQP